MSLPTLERLRFERGLPQRIYCDNGLPQKSSRQSFSVLAYTASRYRGASPSGFHRRGITR